MDGELLNILHVIQCFMYVISHQKKKRLKYDAEKLTILKRQKRRRLILTQLLKQKIRNCWVQPELLLNNHGNFWEVTVPNYTGNLISISY